MAVALTARDCGAGGVGAGTGDAGAAVGAEAVVPTFSPALYSRSSATNSLFSQNPKARCCSPALAIASFNS